MGSVNCAVETIAGDEFQFYITVEISNLGPASVRSARLLGFHN